MHYGFTIIKPPQISPSDISKAKQFKDFDYYNDVEEKVALTSWYIDRDLHNQSQLIAIHYKKPRENLYSFEIMGSDKSISEGLLLKCALAVLYELGWTNLYIDINSIGDKESVGKFERELGAYFRKHTHTLSAKLNQKFRKNHYSILTDNSPESQSFRQDAPQTVGSLSDIARVHFKEVLEFLETFSVAYKIKPNVLSNKLYASYTVFEIRNDDQLLAYGYRYNHLARKIGAKRDIPSVGLTVLVKKQPKFSKKVIIKNIKKPKFYLVQLGETAKLKVLNVIEMLRREKIPVYHSITKDKMVGQLSGAEYMKATHVLVMGQKEAVENTMIVRSIASREQETVPLDKLVKFLKKL